MSKFNVKDLVRCGDIKLIDLIVDMGESHCDPEYFDKLDKDGTLKEKQV